MRDLQLLPILCIPGDLIEVRVPRQVQNDLLAILRKALVQLFEVVGHHRGQVEHLLCAIFGSYQHEQQFEVQSKDTAYLPTAGSQR
jgi:hypothetical protein